MKIFVVLVSLCWWGCGDEPEFFSREKMMDPENCRTCHPKHVAEWESSMHAYAADDPVFLAMNSRGQRETQGELGTFCVNCHAPMAVREGLTTDGLNLRDLPQSQKGVTCFFCHTAESVEGEHNNPIKLSGDLAMRGGFDDATANPAHEGVYAATHDSRRLAESSKLCGACHDIVNNKNVHLERTYAEWQESIFSKPDVNLSCGSGCHMSQSSDVVADFEGVPLRTRHDHSFPGVDVAMTQWPGREEQIEKIKTELKNTVLSQVCYNPQGNRIQLAVTNVGAGHNWPSGASQDRRAFVELVAEKDGNVIFQTGVVAEDQSVDYLQDENLLLFHDKGFNENNEPVHMFWEIARIESFLAPPQTTRVMTDPKFNHAVQRDFMLGAQPRPDKITVNVKIESMGQKVLADLVDSGDLDPRFETAWSRFSLCGASLVWTEENAGFDLCLTSGEIPFECGPHRVPDPR